MQAQARFGLVPGGLRVGFKATSTFLQILKLHYFFFLAQSCGISKKRPKFDSVKTCVIDVYSAKKAKKTMNREVSANLKQGKHLQCGTNLSTNSQIS